VSSWGIDSGEDEPTKRYHSEDVREHSSYPARQLAREGWSPGMSHVASAHRITFHLRPNVLWRESRWRCEYGYVSSHWAAKLYIDDITVAHCARDSLTAMLLLAECWRKAVNSDARHSARRGASGAK
jgi:hypothetical protein